MHPPRRPAADTADAAAALTPARRAVLTVGIMLATGLQFLDGTIGFNEQRESDGGSGFAVRWDHRQQFDLSTSLNVDFNYASNTNVVRDNAIDPLQNTQQITSSLNFSKRYNWGTFTVGGNRRQSLSDRSVQQLLPAVTLAPVPIGFGNSITWSPGLSFTNNTNSRTLLPDVVQVLPGGGLDTIEQTGSNRVTALNFDTPIRIGGFNWQNSLQATDEPCGRKLDFLLQEMNREINTIGAKADGVRVSELIIAAKAELEKMREQVQNVE